MNIVFKHRPDRQYHWEAYIQPVAYKNPILNNIYSWLWETYGHPGNNWDSHGGWIKLRGDEELSFFNLKWA